METVIKNKPNKAARLLMEKAVKNAGLFLTGKPLKVLRYGRNASGKIIYISYSTERGIEDTYIGDCLADAFSNCVKMISFN